MTSQIKVEELSTIEDWASIAKILEEDPSEASVDAIGPWLLRKARVACAKKGKTILGFIVIIDDVPETSTYLLDVIYIKKSQRRKGIGSSLMEWAVSILNKDKRDCSLFCVVEKPFLLWFYGLFGFNKVGISPHTPEYGETCNILLRKYKDGEK